MNETRSDNATDLFDLDSCEMVPFDMSFAGIICSWINGSSDALEWASLEMSHPDTSMFEAWHADPEVHAAVLTLRGLPMAYGEVWENFEPDAVELARLIVAPALRGRRVAVALIEGLCRMTPASISHKQFLRVRPSNVAALRCYQRVGFQRVTPDIECQYNSNQPIKYIWMGRAASVVHRP